MKVTRIREPAKFLFVMDPADTLNLQTETSLLLMEELVRRQQEVFWLQLEDLALEHDQPVGRVSRVASAEPLKLGAGEWTELNRFDAVLVRKDPPFDTRYLQMTLVLDHLDPGVTQFNEVRALRNFNEKMLPLLWPQFTPPTLVSMNPELLERFVVEHQKVVFKPLHDCSGRGVVVISRDENGEYRRRIAQYLRGDNGKSRFVVAQKFLPSVNRGDKRVYLLNGEPVGVVNRVPREGGFLANIHQGAKCEAAGLSDWEMSIIRRMAPFLREQGVFLAGADFIDGYLTELNITSPSAVRQINAVSGARLQEQIVDAMMARLCRQPCCDHWGARVA